jgi:diketogulonate reductase-like aldo/keto reductase
LKEVLFCYDEAMNIPTKKLQNGFELPVYGMGLARVGGNMEPDTSMDEEWIEAIQQAIANGVTHFDTAEAYANGHSEELLGKAIKDTLREKLIIASKVSAWNKTYEGVITSCEASLKRLGTDYIDLYMLHTFPEEGKPIEKTMKAMTELVDRGLIKHIGVSNLTVNRFKAAQDATPHKIVANQLHYNVKFREVERRGILEYSQQNDVFIVAWKPVQRGELPESDILDELAKKYNKTWRQIAINWLTSQDHVVTICKTTSLEHLQENLGALDWTMEAEDIERIRREFPDQETVGNWPLDYKASLEP